MIEFPCVSCHSLLKVAQQFAGKPSKCPACGAINDTPRLPSATSSANAFSPAEPLAHPFQTDSSSTPPDAPLGENPFASPQTAEPEPHPYYRQRKLPGSWRYAPRSLRFFGNFIDGLLYFLPVLLVVLTLSVLDTIEIEHPETMFLYVMGLVLVAASGTLGICCYQWYLISTTGQSLGKKWLGMQIVVLETPYIRDIGFLRGVLLRNWVLNCIRIVYCVAPVGWLVDAVMIFGEERRCLHDLIAGTVVIDRNSMNSQPM